MRTVSIRLEDLAKMAIKIGFVGENEHTRVRIDCKKAFDEYPGAVATLTVQPPAGEAYPDATTRDGDTVIWDVEDHDLTDEGDGEFQLSFVIDETVMKSYIGRTTICRSILPAGDVPAAIDDWLTRANAALAEIPVEIAAALEEAKESGEFDGRGISDAVLNSDYTLTLTFTDGTSYTTPAIRGEKGDPGKDFNIAKTFRSIIAMVNYTGTDLKLGDFVMISTSSTDNADNGKLFRFGNTNVLPEGTLTANVNSKNGYEVKCDITWDGASDTWTISEYVPSGYGIIYEVTKMTPPAQGAVTNESYLLNLTTGTTKLFISHPNSVTMTNAQVIERWTYICDLSGAKGATGATGDTGFSPIATVSKSDHTATISITDATGTTTAQIVDGDKGDTGSTPVISIGTVSTLTPGSDATASMDVTDPEHPVLSLGIPEGEPGDATIDDSKGIGDTDFVWSANKSATVVGDLKSALGIEFLPFTANYYIDTNKTEGTVVDYTGEDLHTITGRNCSVYSCKEGDPFTIFGSGGNAARLWAFIDSNSKLISKSVGNLAAPDDGLVIYAPQNASKIIINTTQTAYKGISVEKLSNLINLVVTEENVWENVDTTPTRIENYRINTSGKNYADSNGSIVYLTPSEAGRYKVTSNRTSSTYCFLYNIASVSSVADFVAANVSGSRITITTGTAEINVALGQTIAMSSNSKTFTFTTKKLTTVNEFNQSIGLTETMTDEVNEMISDKDQAAYGLSTDATEYVSRVPSYYITPETTPASFSDAYGYLDNKIAQIPKGGKSFIFVTDTHWDGNEKHSPDLISYIRKRTGIQKVLFGGDIFGNATNKYLAAKKAGDYMNRMKRGAGYDFIPCVGDHDNNTVSVASDDTHFLPYTQVEELFVGDLERYSGYHFYDPSEKLADYATPGSDDYNGAMAFFHTVYYTDDVSKKVRYISLNCGNGGNYGPMYNIFGASGTSLLRLQLDWLVETLLSTPTGYDIVVLSHKGNTGYGGAAAEIINAILWGFRLKQSNFSRSPASDTEAIESWRPHSISYNFSSANDVGLIIALNGHSHRDQLGYTGTTNGTYTNEINYVSSGETIIQPLNPTSSQNVQIPLIITSCDSLGAAESQSPSMTAGTVTEQCFDVITILDDKIKMTRIGAGDDRVLYITKTNPES